jgi:hypothetical protein
MNRNYLSKKFSTYLLPLFALVLGTSCTVYQNVPDDDGIYTTERRERVEREPRVIVENSDEHREYENNYFTKELERIDQINGTDILTDIDTYSSINDTIPNETDVDTEPTGRAWGYNDNDDVVININLNDNWGYGWGGWGWGGFYDPFWDPFPRFGWGWNTWGWNRWGWNRWGWNGWGWNHWGWNQPFWGGGYYAWNNWGWNANRFGNYRYGRRLAYNNGFNRRGSSLTRRSSVASRNRTTFSNSRRRSSEVYRSSNSRNVRRGSSNNVRRSSRSVRRNGNSSNSRRRFNSSSNRNNSRSMNRSSSSRSRSFSRGSSRSSSRGSSSRGGGRRGGRN